MVTSFSVVCAISGILIFSMNFTVICIIIGKRLMEQERRFIFIFTMSITDALMGITSCLPLVFDTFYTSIDFGLALVILYYVMESATVISVLVLTVHQYILILHPLQYHNIVTPKRCRYGAAAILVLFITDCTLGGLLSLQVAQNNSKNYAYVTLITTMWHILVPFCTLAVIQGRMFLIAYRHHRAIHAQQQLVRSNGLTRVPSEGTGAPTIVISSLGDIHQQSMDHTPAQSQPVTSSSLSSGCHPQDHSAQDSSTCPREQRAGEATNVSGSTNASSFRGAVTVCILATALIVCWTPRALVSVVNMFVQYHYFSQSNIVILQVSSYMFAVNSFINPLVYAFRIQKIRSVLVSAVRKWKLRCIGERI